MMEKRLLCFSLINEEKCKYGKRCIYAHTKEEQIIDDSRQKAYDLLKADDLSKVTMEEYTLLLSLVHLCEKCLENKCTGGYNCRNGAHSLEVKLCKRDFCTGTCNLNDCPNVIHLPNKGLVPYNKYINLLNRTSNIVESDYLALSSNTYDSSTDEELDNIMSTAW